MNIEVFIIDTSYLCELFQVPGSSNHQSVEEIKRRFEIALNNDARFYVPIACIYELGNKIAKVNKGSIRRDLANKLLKTVKNSIAKNQPWNITPAVSFEQLEQYCNIFASEYAVAEIGLTDTAVISEAHRLKETKFYNRNFSVHIWTKDESLKAREPDTETDPFIG